MMLAAGTKLGRYEIRSKIGEGGMGVAPYAFVNRRGRKFNLLWTDRLFFCYRDKFLCGAAEVLVPSVDDL